MIVSALMVAWTQPAAADPWKHGKGHGHHGHHHADEDEGEEAFRDGTCVIERKWKKHGEYKDKWKCFRRPSRVIVESAPYVILSEPPRLAPRAVPAPFPRVPQPAPQAPAPPETDAPSGGWENPR
ncbi:hypothetical protein [Azospirillum rugosum]|uniref:Uncharacterized protein n=2 Tax=Azospirillum rugosum TaxID=416170 RepID=A0ABS4SWX4_9PROT|nr:hypothetical protein [Azospirillum rugosum]MBP2296764.1 hypothetical protein [Azospirillum rugosum]MDQ0530367.1 hypothetical protein [Azospirillum rugosum]